MLPGGPCLVIDFIDGAPVTGPAQLRLPLADFTGQLAAVLARIHAAAVIAAAVPICAAWARSRPSESGCGPSLRT